MAELHLIKMAGGNLRPANQQDADRLHKIQNGAVLAGDFKQPRNPKFHRKYFALLNFAYEYWNPPIIEYNGIQSEKSFERFRKEVAILTGHYTVTTDIRNNEVRLEAKSISFAAMGDIEFQELYRNTFNVLWEYILKKIEGMTEEVVEKTINQMLSFD